MSLNSVLLGTEMCAVCDIVRVCRHFCTRLYFNIAIFNHLLRTGDLPCKVYVYTIPGTTNPTFTSCMASDLEPEALPSVEGRSFDLLDDIHDQVVDIVESQSGISTEQASQLVSTVAIFVVVAVLVVLKIITCSRSSTSNRRIQLPIPKLLVNASTQTMPPKPTVDASTQDSHSVPVVLSTRDLHGASEGEITVLHSPQSASHVASGSATSSAVRRQESTRPKKTRTYHRVPIF